MPGRTLPTSFTVVKPLVLGGTMRRPGYIATPGLVVSSLGKRVDEYVNRGHLVPNLPQYVANERRTGPLRSTQEFHLSPSELITMAAANP